MMSRMESTSCKFVVLSKMEYLLLVYGDAQDGANDMQVCCDVQDGAFVVSVW